MSKFYKQNVFLAPLLQLLPDNKNVKIKKFAPLSHFLSLCSFTLCRFTLCRVFDPLSFDPVSFDPMSFDPVSFDPGSFDPLSVNRSDANRLGIQECTK